MSEFDEFKLLVNNISENKIKLHDIPIDTYIKLLNLPEYRKNVYKYYCRGRKGPYIVSLGLLFTTKSEYLFAIEANLLELLVYLNENNYYINIDVSLNISVNEDITDYLKSIKN